MRADGKGGLTICNIATDAGTEGQARWWDGATGEPLTPPLIHPGEVYQGVCSRDGAVVTACQNGAAWVWPAAEPINWALDDLRELAEISAGQRLDARRGPVPLAPAEFSRIWKHVRSQRPAHFERSAARVEDWRRYEVEECAAAGLWSAAAWFLDRLRADRPMDWEVAAWRAHVDLASGAAGPAEDKLTAALKLGPPDAVRAWLKSRADLAAAGEHWPTARWYLDHMVLQRPGDAASYAERAVVRGRLGYAAGRIADLEKAVELGAGGGVVAQLAQVHAGADDWRQAASLYAAAVKRGVPAWAESALASLKAMDREGYQKACAMALAQASAGDPGPQQMNQAAWLFALAPGATADYSAVIKQATAAVAATPPADRHNYLNTLGALLYRAGRDREAIDRLREGIKLSRGGAVAEDWIFLGLAHLHLGEADEAKRCLERFHNVPAPPRDTFSWQRIEYDLLREQFESALAESPSNLKK